MEKAVLIQLDQDGRETRCEIESPIHRYQRRRGCDYEEAIAHEGYALELYISGGTYSFCHLYLSRGDEVSGKEGIFHGGYIDVSFRTADWSGKPLRHYIYVDDFFAWLKATTMLASIPGSHIHRAIRGDVED